MPIDIATLSEAQLLELNRRIVVRLRSLQEARMTQQMQGFRLGDRVSFQAPGHDPKHGIVIKCNRKTVTVATDDHHQWNVAPVFLTRVITAEPASDNQPPNRHVIELPSAR